MNEGDVRRSEGRRGSDHTDLSDHSRNYPGRRSEDHLPKTTFTKKFFVVALGLVNAVYLVLEVLAVGTPTCH